MCEINLRQLILANRSDDFTGFIVRATVRPGSLEIPEKMMALVNLAPSTEFLQIYEADLKVDGAFDEVVHGSSIVFHLASPASFDASNQVTHTRIAAQTLEGI